MLKYGDIIDTLGPHFLSIAKDTFLLQASWDIQEHILTFQ